MNCISMGKIWEKREGTPCTAAKITHQVFNLQLHEQLFQNIQVLQSHKRGMKWEGLLVLASTSTGVNSNVFHLL